MKIQPWEPQFSYPTAAAPLPGYLPGHMGSLWTKNALGSGTRKGGGHMAYSDAADTTFALLDEMVKHALQDATQSCDIGLRWEAVAWLWVCCPDIADQLLLTWPEDMPQDIDMQQQALAYLERYPA